MARIIQDARGARKANLKDFKYLIVAFALQDLQGTCTFAMAADVFLVLACVPWELPGKVKFAYVPELFGSCLPALGTGSAWDLPARVLLDNTGGSGPEPSGSACKALYG